MVGAEFLKDRTQLVTWLRGNMGLSKSRRKSIDTTPLFCRANSWQVINDARYRVQLISFLVLVNLGDAQCDGFQSESLNMPPECWATSTLLQRFNIHANNAVQVDILP